MTPPSNDHVWIVTRWICGNGGDDDRVILGVYSTSLHAYEAARDHPDAEVAAYPVDRKVQT